METLESVIYLAKNEGRKLKPTRNEGDVKHDNLPYFEVVNPAFVKGYNYEKHDNAPRMSFIESLMPVVLQNISDKSAMRNMFFNIELHDTYSYLEKFKTQNMYDNCLVWSKRKFDTNVILLPDVYHISNYGGKLNFVDGKIWDAKKNKIGFWGTTTGDVNPARNQRIQTCLWGLDRRDFTDFYITNIAQIKPEDILRVVPNFEKIVTKYKTQEEMLDYKFLLDIPGNTCSWDRVPSIMSSNSLLFKMPCQDVCFYYPMMHDGVHFVQVDETTMRDKFTYYMNNPKEVQFIIENAKRFAKKIFNQNAALLYMKYLFEESFTWNAP